METGFPPQPEARPFARGGFLGGLAAYGVLLAACLAAYATFLPNPFVWDDKICILGNHFIESIANLKLLLHPHSFFYVLPIENSARPLLVASNLIDHWIWGLRPAGYRLDSLLLHALNAYLVMRLSLRLGARRAVGWLAGLIFALHPVHSENLAVVCFRTDILAGLFILAGLLAFLRGREAPDPRARAAWTAAGLALYGGALLSKEMGLIFPVLLWLCERLFGSRSEALVPDEKTGSALRGIPWRYLFLAALTIFYWSFHKARFTYHLGARSQPDAPVSGSVKPEERAASFPLSPPPWKDLHKDRRANFLTMSRVFGDYLRLLAWPHPLQVDYDVAIVKDWKSPGVILSWLLWAMLGGLAWRCRRQRPFWTFAALWLAVGLLPVSNLKPLYNLKAERYLYIPSIGYAWLAAALLAALLERARAASKPGFAVGAAACGGLFLVWGGLCFQRGKDWRSEDGLYRSTLALQSRLPRMYYNLGTLEQKRGAWDEADENFRKAAAIKPDFYEAMTNLGVIAEVRNKPEEALDWYRQAIRQAGGNPMPYNDLAALLARLGRLPEAIQTYEDSLKLDWKQPLVHYDLGVCYQRSGNINQTLAHFETALRQDPRLEWIRIPLSNLYASRGQNAEALRHIEAATGHPSTSLAALIDLGVLYKENGDLPRAFEPFKKAVALDPRSFDAHYNLGTAYDQAGDAVHAQEEFEKAAQLAGPGEARAHYNLAVLWQKAGRMDRATEYYREALKRNPKHVEAMSNLGGILAAEGQVEEAERLDEKALQLDGRPALHNNLANLLAREGKLDAAIVHYQAALAGSEYYHDALQPRAILRINLGNCYARQGKGDLAIREWEAARRLDQNNLESSYHLGQAYEEQGDIPEAVMLWREILRVRPGDPSAEKALQRLSPPHP